MVETSRFQAMGQLDSVLVQMSPTVAMLMRWMLLGSLMITNSSSEA
jgi:hypothetical protein